MENEMVDQVANEQVAAEVPQQSQPVSYEPSVQEAPKEKLVPQSDVNKIVGTTRVEARQDGYNRAKSEYEQKLNELQSAHAHVPETQGVSKEAIKATLQEMIEQHEAQQIVGSFQQKMASVDKEKYQDFDAVCGTMNFQAIPMVVANVSRLDNAAEVMYELAKNPLKAMELNNLALTMPLAAKGEFARLSASIKANEDASKLRQPPRPLSQITPSTRHTDSGDASSMSVDDLRSSHWLR